MKSRAPLSPPFAQLPLGAASAAAPILPARSPLGQRLAGALQARVMKSGGRLRRLELALRHTLAAGTGWSTDWQLRAAIELTATASARPALSLRTIDRGALPPGSALEELWYWVADSSVAGGLDAPVLSERVQFHDAARHASLEVIRHRVLRAAGALERLPASLEVKTGRRKPTLPVDADDADLDSPESTTESATESATESTTESAMVSAMRSAPRSARGTAPGWIPVARLIARFPGREATHGDTQVELWCEQRDPTLVALLRDCATRLDPRTALAGRDPNAPTF